MYDFIVNDVHPLNHRSTLIGSFELERRPIRVYICMLGFVQVVGEGYVFICYGKSNTPFFSLC